MDWVDRPQNYKGLYGILQLLQSSYLDNFLLKTIKLGWVPFHSLPFQLKCLVFNLIDIRNSPHCSHVSAMGYGKISARLAGIPAPRYRDLG